MVVLLKRKISACNRGYQLVDKKNMLIFRHQINLFHEIRVQWKAIKSKLSQVALTIGDIGDYFTRPDISDYFSRCEC